MKTTIAYPVVRMLLLVGAILASLIPGAWSQQDLRTATLVGTVTDSSGATVANASVVVTNIDTQVVTRSKTNDTGAYYLPFSTSEITGSLSRPPALRSSTRLASSSKRAKFPASM